MVKCVDHGKKKILDIEQLLFANLLNFLNNEKKELFIWNLHGNVVAVGRGRFGAIG